MGDDLSLPEREAGRTPMQWSDAPHGGFSRAKDVVAPVIDDETYGFRRVNVAKQRTDMDSLLQWTSRLLRTRRECPEVSWGCCTVLDVPKEVLALRYDFSRTVMVTVHNFVEAKQRVELCLDGCGEQPLVDLLTGESTAPAKNGRHTIDLPRYGYKWLRVGGADNTLDRATF